MAILDSAVSGIPINKCPRCGQWEYELRHITKGERDPSTRPDNWRRYLPWNWHGEMVCDHTWYRQCRNCRYVGPDEDFTEFDP